MRWMVAICDLIARGMAHRPGHNTRGSEMEQDPFRPVHESSLPSVTNC